MTWAKGDDRYDDTRKIKRAWRMSGYAVGLHWMAITASARHESDGLVDPEWLAERLALIPREAADTAVAVLVKEGLFERLPAGETRAATDTKGFAVTIGPVDEDTYIVHDFLDFNPSSAQLAERRNRDARRKAEARASDGTDTDVHADSDVGPSGQDADSAGTKTVVLAPARVPGPSRPVTEPKIAATPQSASARDQESPSQVETTACPRCHAGPGEQCMGVRGRRKSAHIERHHAVGELLHLPRDRQGRRLNQPKGYTPDPWATSAQAEHFPTASVTDIEAAMFKLKCRRRAVTVEAVRSILEAAAA